MKSVKFLLFISMVMLFRSSVSAENAVQISPEQFTNLGITLGKPAPVSQFPVLYAPAKVVVPPSHEYIVSTSQSGLITKLNASIGDTVKKGEVLAEINSPALLALQGQYIKANSLLQLATATYNRDKKLFKEGVISDRRQQETFSQYNAAVMDANESRQMLEIAGMSPGAIKQLGGSHRLNSELTVTAPISGVVMERMAVAGTRIDSMAPLYHIANLDTLWLEINIPQERIGAVKIGDQVMIEHTDISADISLLGQSVNAENQTVLARAVIKSSKEALASAAIRVGQKLNIQVIQPSEQSLFSIPNTAIAQNEGKSFIFIRNQSGFQVSPIKIIGKQGDESVISGELTGNEEIAVKGAVALKANWLGLGGAE